MDTLTEDDRRQWRELRACIESLRLMAQSPITAVLRPAAALRVIVRHVAIRLHAARSAIEDSAARLTAHAPHQSPIGTAASGFGVSGDLYKRFESQVPA